MSYLIAIPTYKRCKILKQRTLKLLKKHNIPNKIIYIFVANTSEYEIYKQSFPDYSNIIIGKPTLKNQRNFIRTYFPMGCHIVQMDDDIAQLYQLKINKSITDKYKQKSMMPLLNLDKFIKLAFKESEKTGFYLWGAYPIDNAYFMSDKISYDLRIIVGPFWGHINRHHNKFKNSLNEKEDIERTIKYYINDKGVIRFNNVSIGTSYYKTPGGMSEDKEKRKIEALSSAKYLVNKYPEYCKLNLKKKSGYADVTLIRNPKIN
jgi:hypothetical protein